jgi:capsid assembly protease
MSFDRICNLMFDQPHLYHPGKAETLVRALGPRLTGLPIRVVNGEGGVEHTAFANGRPSAGILGDRLGRAYDRHDVIPFQVIDNIAVIPIEGTLVQKGAWIGQSSGETSYQGLMTQVSRAATRAGIKGAVFEIDSFGGMVNGAFETAAAMRALSKQMPTVAILTDYAYSAGYLLASQARQIIMPEFGGTGSVGVVTMHADWSRALEMEGIDVTFIFSGKHKVDGNPYEPLPEDVAQQLQAVVDAMRDRFAAEVGKGRGKRFTKADAMKTEAQTYSAKDAVDLGLVDAIGDPLQAFDAFIREVNRN